MASRFRAYKTTVQVAEEITTYGTAETSAQHNWVGYLQSVSEDKSRNMEGVKVIGARNTRKQVDGKLESKITLEVRENVANLLHYAFGRTHVQPTMQCKATTSGGDTTAFAEYTAKATTIKLASVTNFTAHDVVQLDDPTNDLMYLTRISALGAAEADSTITPVVPVDLIVTATTIKEVDASDTTAASLVGATSVRCRSGWEGKFGAGVEVMWYDGEHTEVRTLTSVDDTNRLNFSALTWAHPANTIIAAIDDATNSKVTAITAVEAIGENDIAVTSESGFDAAEHAYILGVTTDEYPVLRLIESSTTNKVIMSKGIPYATTNSDFLAEHYGAGPYQHDIYFAENDTLPSCTIEVTREASTNSQSRYDGCVCNSAELSIEAGGILQGTYEFITQFPVHGTGTVTTSASASADKSRKPWTWDEMVVEYSTNDGSTWTAFTDAQRLSIGLNNNAEGEHFLGSSKDISEVTPGMREYTYSMSMLPAVAATFYIEGAKSTTAQTEYAWRITWNRSGSEYDSLQFVLKGGFLDPASLEVAADSKVTQELTWNFQSDDNINDEIGYARIITQNPNLYCDEGLTS
jgi:hypothetical protein